MANANTHSNWGMARVIIASSAGTAFEWYDFFIFGSLTQVISKTFFASLPPTASLIAALGLFAAGFAFRPLGAVIFGSLGDRMGRKGAFLITVSLMGGATFLIGCLPTYAQAGWIAPALLIFLRICQGTALGGEYGGAAIYVAEHAADHRRGFSTGWIQSSAAFGLLAALLIILVTRTLIGEDAFAAWGWRIPFLASAILLGVSIWLRTKLAESPAFVALQAEGQVCKAPLREAFADPASLRQVAIAFFGFMCAQGAVWYTTFFYIQVFLEKMVGLPGATVNLVVMVMTLVSAPLYVFFGWLSDRVGRKPVMIAGMMVALAAYFPGYHAIAGAANPALIAAQAATPVAVVTDPATCSVQFDPAGTRHFATACDIAKSLLAGSGLSYSDVPTSDGQTSITVGNTRVPIPNGVGLDAKALKTPKNRNRRPAQDNPHRRRLSGEGRARAGRLVHPFRLADPVHHRRLRALRPDGGGAGRDVPDPGSLHRDEPALPCRQRLGRRVPARHQLRDRRDHRKSLRRPVVCGCVHRDFSHHCAIVHEGNQRPAADIGEPHASRDRHRPALDHGRRRRPAQAPRRRAAPARRPRPVRRGPQR